MSIILTHPKTLHFETSRSSPEHVFVRQKPRKLALPLNLALPQFVALSLSSHTHTVALLSYFLLYTEFAISNDDVLKVIRVSGGAVSFCLAAQHIGCREEIPKI